MNTKGSKHLDLSNRSFIEQGLNNNSSKTSIAEVIGMDKSSVCKEIKNIVMTQNYHVRVYQMLAHMIVKRFHHVDTILSAKKSALTEFQSIVKSVIKLKESLMDVTKKVAVSLPNVYIRLCVNEE